MDTVYVVMGTTGEYSYRSEWAVCAYADEQMANDHVLKAEAWVRENCTDGSRMPGTGSTRYGNNRALENPWDPDMQVDYTGTGYWPVAVPVLSSVPTAEAPMKKEQTDGG